MKQKIIKNPYHKKSKRIARGISAGGGKTAGRGTKGQKSRSGFNIPKRFEGGQTNLSMRLPKLKGFNKKHKKRVIITLSDLNKYFKDKDTLRYEDLIKSNLVKKGQKVKILNNGELTTNIKIVDICTSKSVKVILEKSTKSNKP